MKIAIIELCEDHVALQKRKDIISVLANKCIIILQFYIK